MPLGPRDIGELVHVPIGRHGAQRGGSRASRRSRGPRRWSSTEKRHAVHADLVRPVGSVSIASGWMYSKSSRRPLPSGVWSMAMLAWLPSRPTAVSVHSLTVSRPTTVRPRSVKKAIVASRSRTAIPTFLEFDGHGWHATESARFASGQLAAGSGSVGQETTSQSPAPILGPSLLWDSEPDLSSRHGGGITQPLTRRNDARPTAADASIN